MVVRIVVFLIINFAALALGGLFTGKGVPSDWYQGLNKAPWTPPGWVFGAAWTLIMICFTVYMSVLWGKTENRNLLIALFATQWILNVGWNPVFFYHHQAFWGLIVISALTILIAFFLFNYAKPLGIYSVWILPYSIWLIIATSLNAFIYLKN